MKNLFYSWLFCTLFISCNDFLEPKSDYEFVPETVEALNEILLGNGYLMSGTDGLDIASILQLLDDDVECSTWASYEDSYSEKVSGYLRMLYTWQPNAFQSLYLDDMLTGSYNIYKNYYTKILGVNAVLDMIDEVEGEEDERRDVRAQAHALRAFYYFNLVNLYGKPYCVDKNALGVPLKLTSAMEGDGFPRNTVEECYTQILFDLKEAEKNYLANPQEMQFRKNYRTNLPMVQLLLARVYLHMEDWENARTYAQKVINDWGLQLVNFNNLPSREDNYLNFTSFNTNTEAIYSYGSIYAFTSAFNNIVRQDGDGYTRDVFCASQELIACYDETPGDLRKKEYLIAEYYFPQYYHIYSKFLVSWSNSPNQSYSSFARVFRLAEAYLIQAEASAEMFKAGQASADEALKPLNELRRTRFTPPYTEVRIAAPDELIEFIHRERRRELCFEDHRWFDLRRWGMPRIEHKWHVDAQTTLTYVLEEGDPGYVLPFPEEEFQLNDQLIQNEQVASRNPLN